MADLATFPRSPLGHWPTPLEPAERLAAAVGTGEIWLKRDDCSGLATGGNKTRKLEFLLGRAVDDGATGVITFGARQSNHARQTAAACARAGLACHLILVESVDRPDPHYQRSGNRLLDEVLGATVHPVVDDEAAMMRAATLHDDDPSLTVIEPGGSDATGTLGYVAMVDELVDQCRRLGVIPARVVCASSTGGTAAGLALGLGRTGVDAVVDAVAVYDDAAATAARIDRLITETGAHLDGPGPVPVETHAGQLGPGYGIPTEASRAALDVLARTEAVLLDPVYTAKAFAHVLATSSPTDGTTVFVHTGGQAGLFAYADDWFA